MPEQGYYVLYKDPEDHYGWCANVFYGPWRFWRQSAVTKDFAEMDKTRAARTYPKAEFAIVPSTREPLSTLRT